MQYIRQNIFWFLCQTYHSKKRKEKKKRKKCGRVISRIQLILAFLYSEKWWRGIFLERYWLYGDSWYPHETKKYNLQKCVSPPLSLSLSWNSQRRINSTSLFFSFALLFDISYVTFFVRTLCATSTVVIRTILLTNYTRGEKPHTIWNLRHNAAQSTTVCHYASVYDEFTFSYQLTGKSYGHTKRWNGRTQGPRDGYQFRKNPVTIYIKLHRLPETLFLK